MNSDDFFRSLDGITPETAMLIGIVVLAIAVIVLVIWVVLVSRKLRKVTNMVLAQFELTKRLNGGVIDGEGASNIQRIVPAAQGGKAKAARNGKVASYNTGSHPAVSGPISPSQSARIGAVGEPNPYGAQSYGYASMPPDVAAAIQAHSQVGQGHAAQISQPIGKTLSPATSGAFDQLAADMEDFLKGYKRDTAAQNTGMFGRKRPTIPFGDERPEGDQLVEYMDEAMSVRFDPDSIDLGKVSGYNDR